MARKMAKSPMDEELNELSDVRKNFDQAMSKELASSSTVELSEVHDEYDESMFNEMLEELGLRKQFYKVTRKTRLQHYCILHLMAIRRNQDAVFSVKAMGRTEKLAERQACKYAFPTVLNWVQQGKHF